MKNHTHIAIFSILFLYGVLITFLYFDLRKKSGSSDYHVSIRNPAIEEFMINSINTDNRTMNLKSSLVSINRDTISLGDIIPASSHSLIFRHSVFSCNSCINETCIKLIQMQDSLKCVNIILLPYYETVREMIVQNTNSFRNKFPIYLVSENSIGLPLDEMNVPYLVFIDDGKTSKHTFIVDSSHPDLIDRYLQMISRKYCR